MLDPIVLAWGIISAVSLVVMALSLARIAWLLRPVQTRDGIELHQALARRRAAQNYVGGPREAVDVGPTVAERPVC